MARLRWMENARTGDEGTVCTHDNKLFFDDDDAYINASASGTLDLVATTVKITGDLDVSGGLSYGSETVSLNQSLMGTLTVGITGAGYDVLFYGDAGGGQFLWDQDQDTNGGVTMTGSFDMTGDMGIVGATVITGTVTISSTLTMAGATTFNEAVTVGASGTGYDVKFYGDTATTYMQWDESVDDLLLVGTATQFAVAGTTNATSATTGSIRTAGGIGIVQDLWVGGLSELVGAVTIGDAVGITGAVSITGNVGITGNVTIAGATTGITISGAGTNAIVITQTGSTSTIGSCIAIGTSAIPITTATSATSAVRVYSDFSNTTDLNYHVGAWFSSRYTADGDAAASVYTLRGHAEVEGTLTAASGSQYIEGVHGRVKVSGAIVNSAAMVMGMKAEVLNGGASTTTVSHMACLWADWQNTDTVTGETECLYLTDNAAATTVDQCMFIYGDFSYFIKFDNACTTFVDATATAGDQCVGHIKIRYKDADAYINVFSDNS